MMKNSQRKIKYITALLSLAAAALIIIALLTNLPGKQGGGEQSSPAPGQATGHAYAQATETAAENAPEQSPKKEQNLINPSGKTLQARISTPEGYSRTAVKKDSLGDFLRNYKMKKDGSPILFYNGEEKGSDNHAAVFRLPMENEDLQQCADSIMRVYAEYYLHTGQPDKIAFHFVDGFLAQYSKWRRGYRISVGERSSSWVKTAPPDDSYDSFKKYMRIVFAYAGTLSMEQESKKIKLGQLRIGDVFLQGGSPGHVVMVVDICENSAGKKAFLLAQGYMPAQQFHVLKNMAHPENPWYYQEEVKYPFETPEYTFEKGSLRRLEY